MLFIITCYVYIRVSFSKFYFARLYSTAFTRCEFLSNHVLIYSSISSNDPFSIKIPFMKVRIIKYT